MTVTVERVRAPVSPNEIRARIARVPRVSLALLPTPLHELPRLAAELGIGRLFVKRDDLTGLAFGGNKARNLEFRMADAVAQGAEVFIAGLEAQSNSARMVTAAANLLGMQAELVLRRDPAREFDWQGNLLVDRVLGASVRFVSTSSADEMDRALLAVAAEVRAAGRKPFVMNHAPSFAMGSAVAYVLCTLEIVEQLGALGVAPTHLYMASGNKGHAGLIVGRKLLGLAYRTVAISQHYADDRVSGAVGAALDALRAMDWELDVSAADVESYDSYVETAYGSPSPSGLAALRLCARLESLLLDPIYTAKAMAGLIDHARRGLLGASDVVVFIHTGGLPALFAFKDDILAAL
ncbi:MAG TPA: pyridoxal-phosphate dependent enzyme [Chloroflexota bacterium]|jgi:1-aminocyclopropane-1-carboxylate deaminase/D-cysteine desulfhydrase-like pyridoxal-dependent ACC family enzyme